MLELKKLDTLLTKKSAKEFFSKLGENDTTVFIHDTSKSYEYYGIEQLLLILQSIDSRITTLKIDANFFEFLHRNKFVTPVMNALPATIKSITIEYANAQQSILLQQYRNTLNRGQTGIPADTLLPKNKSITSVCFEGFPYYFNEKEQKFYLLPQVWQSLNGYNSVSFVTSLQTLNFTRDGTSVMSRIAPEQLKLFINFIQIFPYEVVEYIFQYYAQAFADGIQEYKNKDIPIKFLSSIEEQFPNSIDNAYKKRKLFLTNSDPELYRKKGTFAFEIAPGKKTKLLKDTQTDKAVTHEIALQVQTIKSISANTQFPEKTDKAISVIPMESKNETAQQASSTLSLEILNPAYWSDNARPVAHEIINLYLYGKELEKKDKQAAKTVNDLTIKLFNLLQNLPNKDNSVAMQQFGQKFMRELHSKDKDMAKHREYWKVILANFAIALTLIGAFVFAAKLIKTGHGFFNATKREQLVDNIENKMSAVLQG